MKKFKIVTIVGTRPEIIRLSCVIKHLDIHTDHLLVHTGQNYDYELNQIFFDDLGLRKPDFFLNAAGSNAAETIGNVITETDRILAETNPNAVLVLGDTNSCLSVIPAKRRKIPTFHMEAGNRCFDMRVPEEINRKIVDHTADINLTYSSIAREYLLAEGLPADQIIKTGSPMYEVLNAYIGKAESSGILKKLDISKGKYFLISSHREENIDSRKNLEKVINVINKLAGKYKQPIIVSTHPRTRKAIEAGKYKFNKLVRLLNPLSFTDYMKLQIDSRAVLSDSGTITEESSILNFPALNIRESHERPEGMEEAAVMMTGLEIERIFQAIGLIEKSQFNKSDSYKIVEDYYVKNVSNKILKIILSYTDYVKRVVWKEY
tara:strand:+ start:983 stop:2113 length:1131 start_codon:yes stop_codon:yes gene_type:complete